MPPLSERRRGRVVCGQLFRNVVRAVALGVLHRFDFLAALAAQDADEAAYGVRLPATRTHYLASVTPLARFIIAMTPAFLLLRSVALCFRGVALLALTPHSSLGERTKAGETARGSMAAIRRKLSARTPFLKATK